MKKIYDLEERTFQYAKRCRLFVKTLPRTIANVEDGKQLIRAAGSVGANYIEANEKVGPKDFAYRIKVSRKEAKESVYWLRLIKETNSLESSAHKECCSLMQEGLENRKILSQILLNHKSQS